MENECKWDLQNNPEANLGILPRNFNFTSCDFAASLATHWPCINAPCLAANSRVKASNKPKSAEPSLDEARLEFLLQIVSPSQKKRQHWSTISLFGPTEFANLYLIDLVGTNPYKIWTRPQVVPKSSNTMGSLSTGPCLPRLSSASRRDLRSIPLIDFLMPLFGKQSGKFPQNPVLILVDILLAFLNYHETGG